MERKRGLRAPAPMRTLKERHKARQHHNRKHEAVRPLHMLLTAPARLKPEDAAREHDAKKTEVAGELPCQQRNSERLNHRYLLPRSCPILVVLPPGGKLGASGFAAACPFAMLEGMKRAFAIAIVVLLALGMIGLFFPAFVAGTR